MKPFDSSGICCSVCIVAINSVRNWHTNFFSHTFFYEPMVEYIFSITLINVKIKTKRMGRLLSTSVRPIASFPFRVLKNGVSLRDISDPKDKRIVRAGFIKIKTIVRVFRDCFSKFLTPPLPPTHSTIMNLCWPSL